MRQSLSEAKNPVESEDPPGHCGGAVRRAAEKGGVRRPLGGESPRDSERLAEQGNASEDTPRASCTSCQDPQADRGYVKHSKATGSRWTETVKREERKENLLWSQATGDPLSRLSTSPTVLGESAPGSYSVQAPKEHGGLSDFAAARDGQPRFLGGTNRSGVSAGEQSVWVRVHDLTGDASELPKRSGRSVKPVDARSANAYDHQQDPRHLKDREQNVLTPPPVASSPESVLTPRAPSPVTGGHREEAGALVPHVSTSHPGETAVCRHSSRTTQCSSAEFFCAPPLRSQPRSSLAHVVEDCQLVGCPPSFDVSPWPPRANHSTDANCGTTEKASCRLEAPQHHSACSSPSGAWSPTGQSPTRGSPGPAMAVKKDNSSTQYANVSKTRLRRRAAALFRELVRAEALQPDTAEALRVAVQKQLYGAKPHSASGKFILSSEEEELLQCTFRPQINRTKKEGDARTRQPWWQRLYNGHRTSDLKRELEELQIRVRLMTEAENEDHDNGDRNRASEESQVRGTTPTSRSSRPGRGAARHMSKPCLGGGHFDVMEGGPRVSNASCSSKERFEPSTEECSLPRVLREQRGRRRAASQTGATLRKSVRFATPDAEASTDKDKFSRRATPRVQRVLPLTRRSLDCPVPRVTRSLRCGSPSYTRGTNGPPRQTLAEHNLSASEKRRSADPVVGARKNLPVTATSEQSEPRGRFDELEREEERNCGFFTPYVARSQSARICTPSQAKTSRTRVAISAKWRSDRSTTVASKPTASKRDDPSRRVGAGEAVPGETRTESCISRQLLKTYLGGRQFVPGWLDVW